MWDAASGQSRLCSGSAPDFQAPCAKPVVLFCAQRSTNSISLAFHAFSMGCMRCHDAMMPCLCAYLFLLLAVLLAAACLVVEVAAGPVNGLLLALLFCDFFFSCFCCDAALAVLG